MDTSKIIRGVVSNGRYTVTAPIVKEDYGLYLKIEGIELPSTYEVDFSNSESSGTSVTMIGNSDGVLIPSQFISTGKDIFAFLYHVGEDFGRTVYKFRIPNKVRPDRTDEEPTPEEQSVIDQTISALNDAVESTQEAQQAIEDMTVSAQTLAEGESATVTKTESEGVVHLEFGIPRGATGVKGDKGDKGDTGATGAQGIQGAKGDTGADGYSPTVTITPITGGHRITITDADGTETADVMDGDDYTLTAQDKQDIAELVDMSEIQEDVGDLKEGLSDIEDEIAELPKSVTPEETEADLYISDANGNVLAEFADGHIKTKNFDSADIDVDGDVFTVPSDSDADADISDVNGNVLARFKDGNLYTKNFDSTLIRNLTGKKWVCLGDSLTEHNQRTTLNYHDYIAQETGITVHNLGHSGCGYAKIGGNGQNFGDEAEEIPSDANVITVFGSGNDGSSGLDIGTSTDSGTTTICGYINATFDKIYAEHPTTPLGVITPTPWANNEPSDSSTWMKNYTEALIAVCTRRGIPYLDLYHCSNLHPSDVNFRPLAYSKDGGDGVHPDETGHALIAPRIRQFLFSLI